MGLYLGLGCATAVGLKHSPLLSIDRSKRFIASSYFLLINIDTCTLDRLKENQCRIVRVLLEMEEDRVVIPFPEVETRIKQDRLVFHRVSHPLRAPSFWRLG